MTSSLPSAREALAEASDFAQDVWRDCWPVMLLIVVGRTLVFLGHHVSSIDWRPGLWPMLGEALTLGYIPLFGALYRLGIGGPSLDSLGWGGFQWTGVEWRLLGVWIVLGFALSVCAAPLAIVSFPLLYLFQHHAAVSLGPLGGWSLAAILLAPFWLAFAAGALFLWGRLGLAASRTTARGWVSPFAGWSLTRGMGWTIGLSWLVTQLPMVFGWIGLWVMGLAEAGDISAGPAATWPVIDAFGAGVVVASLAVAIQAPLSVGLLAGFYRWLSEDEDKRASTPISTGYAEDSGAPPPPLTDETPKLATPNSALSFWPHTVLPRVYPQTPPEAPTVGALFVEESAEPEAASPTRKSDHLSPEIPSEPPLEPPPEPLRGADHVPVFHSPPDEAPSAPVSDPEPPLASAAEPDQITLPHEHHDGEEPHA